MIEAWAEAGDPELELHEKEERPESAQRSSAVAASIHTENSQVSCRRWAATTACPTSKEIRQSGQRAARLASRN